MTTEACAKPCVRFSLGRLTGVSTTSKAAPWLSISYGEIRPHVALLDLVMPEMNGVELAVEIRQLENAPKIVLMSSHFTPEEAAVLARLFGDGNFVPKSEAGISLIPTINRLLPEECQAQGASA